MDFTIGCQALQKTLDLQMPTGEWGHLNCDWMARYERVGRHERTNKVLNQVMRKSNVYRTLRACENLRLFLGRSANSRIRRAVDWICQQMQSGWFTEWDQFATGSGDPDSRFVAIEKAPDIRHTAEALLLLLRFEPSLSIDVRKGLENILQTQRPTGDWPRKPGFNGPEYLRTACCLELLLYATSGPVRKKLARLGTPLHFYERAKIALDRGLAWVSEHAAVDGGLWDSEYKTAMVLECIGDCLLQRREYSHVVHSAVAALLDCRQGSGWTDREKHPSVRSDEQHVYECTVRVAAALCKLQGPHLHFDPAVLAPTRTFLHNRFDPNIIDASDYRYYLQVFVPDADEFRSKFPNTYFHDYLSYKQEANPSAHPERDFVCRAHLDWICDCLDRLYGLEEGRTHGMQNYAQAYLEKENELLALAESFHHLACGTELQDLADGLLAFMTEQDREVLRRAYSTLRQHDPSLPERKLTLARRVYLELREIMIEVLTRAVQRSADGTLPSAQ